MDRRERMSIPLVALKELVRGMRKDIWTALPAIAQGYDASKRTVSAQPAIKVKFFNEDGTGTDTDMPVIPDVPVLFMGGGPFMLTMPIPDNTEGLLIFASRCIDSFWRSGGVQAQAEFRMHDLSDAMFLPSPISQANEMSAPSTENLRIGLKDGSAYVEITPTGKILLKPGVEGVECQGNLLVTGNMQLAGSIVAEDGTTYQGNLRTGGDIIAGYGTGDSVTLKEHNHPYVKPTGPSTPDNTGSPNAGT